MTFHSVLGRHSDKDRVWLRALVAEQLPRRGKKQGTDPATLAKRRWETNLTVRKSLAANMIHVKQSPVATKDSACVKLRLGN